MASSDYSSPFLRCVRHRWVIPRRGAQSLRDTVEASIPAWWDLGPEYADVVPSHCEWWQGLPSSGLQRQSTVSPVDMVGDFRILWVWSLKGTTVHSVFSFSIIQIQVLYTIQYKDLYRNCKYMNDYECICIYATRNLPIFHMVGMSLASLSFVTASVSSPLQWVLCACEP